MCLQPPLYSTCTAQPAHECDGLSTLPAIAAFSTIGRHQELDSRPGSAECDGLSTTIKLSVFLCFNNNFGNEMMMICTPTSVCAATVFERDK